MDKVILSQSLVAGSLGLTVGAVGERDGGLVFALPVRHLTMDDSSPSRQRPLLLLLMEMHASNRLLGSFCLLVRCCHGSSWVFCQRFATAIDLLHLGHVSRQLYHGAETRFSTSHRLFTVK